MFKFFKRRPKPDSQIAPQVTEQPLGHDVGLAAQTPAGVSASMSVTELAAVTLTNVARQRLGEAQTSLANDGTDGLFRRFPELDHGIGDNAPSPIMMLINFGGRPNPVTVGWCDWRGEDEPGQVLEQVLETCLNLNLAPPSLVPGGIELESEEAFSLADSALQDVGMRLLFIDVDSDMYYFTVVTQLQLDQLNGRQGTGFKLKSVANL